MAIVKGKDANRLLMTGLGVFGATFVAAQATDAVGQSQNQVVKEYAREIVGGLLTVGGAMLMGNKDLRIVGIAVGGTGISTMASGLVRRARGNQGAAQKQNGGDFQLVPSFPFDPGDIRLASAMNGNGRRAFNLI